MLMKLFDRNDRNDQNDQNDQNDRNDRKSAHAGAAHVGAAHAGVAHAGAGVDAAAVVADQRASWEEGVEVFVGFFVSFWTKEAVTAPAFPGSSG